MPRQLWIDDHIEFRGDAAHRSNVDGLMQPTKVHFHDHFLADTLDTNKYVVTIGGTADGISIQVAVGGQCRFTTGSGDSQACFLATAINWEDDMNAVCEARIKIADVSLTHLFFGFTDADTYTTPATPIDYDGGAKATAATVATGFVVDADYLSSSIMCSGVGATDIDSGTDWADGEWHTLRIELTPDADAFFYLDGSSVAHLVDAIATSGTALAMMMCISTRTTGGQWVYLDRWDAWQNQGE